MVVGWTVGNGNGYRISFEWHVNETIPDDQDNLT